MPITDKIIARGKRSFPVIFPKGSTRAGKSHGQSIGGKIQISTVQEIEQTITQLPKDDLGVLREWFEEFEAKMWDNQFEEDVQSGRLEKLANEAIVDFRAGRCKQL